MIASRGLKYACIFRKSRFERTSVLLILATLTGFVGGSTVGFVTGRAQCVPHPLLLTCPLPLHGTDDSRTTAQRPPV